MKKKVLVIATTFPRWKNDTTPRFVYDLSERLASKYRIIVLAPHYKGALKKEKIGRLDVRRFAYFKPESLQRLCYNGGIIPNMKSSVLAKIQMPLLIISEFFNAYKLIKKEKICLIHAHWILPQGFVAIFLKKIFKLPLLVTVHGSDLFPLKNVFFKNLQKFVFKNTDFITVNTPATKSELISRFPEYNGKIKVIPMGVNPSFFRRIDIKKPAKYSKNKILLFVGRLSDQKGLQYLISALPKIVSYYQNTRLLIIGEGPYKPILEQRIRNLNVVKHVEFLGSLTADEIVKYQNYSDVFVLPSLSNKTGTEALGLSLLEAMSSGCAVIGTDVGGIPFIIKNDYNGILVRQKDSKSLSNAIINLLKNRKKAKMLGKNAVKFVKENYSWEKISKEFMQIYDSMLKW